MFKLFSFCVLSLFLVSCSVVIPYHTQQPECLEFSLYPITLYLITNVSQFPVKPSSNLVTGMWVLRGGLVEEIWVCAEKNGEIWTPAPGVIDHEMRHALNHRNHAAIKNPDISSIVDVIILHEVTIADLMQEE